MDMENRVGVMKTDKFCFVLFFFMWEIKCMIVMSIKKIRKKG